MDVPETPQPFSSRFGLFPLEKAAPASNIKCSSLGKTKKKEKLFESNETNHYHTYISHDLEKAF